MAMFAGFASAENPAAKVEKGSEHKIKTEYTEDYDKAMSEALKEGKIVLLEFTGSKWCPPCKMFHKFILDSEEFAKYAKKELKVVLADFERGGIPTSKKHAKDHSTLAERFGIRAFPTIILIDPKSDTMSGMRGLPTTKPNEMIEIIESFKEKAVAARAKDEAKKSSESK